MHRLFETEIASQFEERNMRKATRGLLCWMSKLKLLTFYVRYSKDDEQYIRYKHLHHDEVVCCHDTILYRNLNILR